MVADSAKALQLDLFPSADGPAPKGGDTRHNHLLFSGVTDVRGKLAAERQGQPNDQGGHPMPELDELPPLLAEIAEVIGAQAATILAENKGGRVVYIPAQADADHWLSKMIGHDLANKLCALYRVGSGGTQGTSITIPMARYARRAMVWEDVLALGLSVSETATRMGCHVRTVHRYRAKLGYSDGVSAPSPR